LLFCTRRRWCACDDDDDSDDGLSSSSPPTFEEEKFDEVACVVLEGGKVFDEELCEDDINGEQKRRLGVRRDERSLSDDANVDDERRERRGF
jgi:hypothetical protein